MGGGERGEVAGKELSAFLPACESTKADVVVDSVN